MRRTDEELEAALRGGGPGNKAYEGAMAELSRRSAERQEKWAQRAFYAAAAAAIIGSISIVAALV